MSTKKKPVKPDAVPPPAPPIRRARLQVVIARMDGTQDRHTFDMPAVEVGEVVSFTVKPVEEVSNG